MSVENFWIGFFSVEVNLRSLMSGKEQAAVLALNSREPLQNILVSLILSASSYPVAADEIVPKDKVLESWAMWLFPM